MCPRVLQMICLHGSLNARPVEGGGVAILTYQKPTWPRISRKRSAVALRVHYGLKSTRWAFQKCKVCNGCLKSVPRNLRRGLVCRRPSTAMLSQSKMYLRRGLVCRRPSTAMLSQSKCTNKLCIYDESLHRGPWKTCHVIFLRNFDKWWPIFEFLPRYACI